MVTPATAMLIVACSVACYTDLTDGKIPNGITLPLAMAGVVLHATEAEPLVGLLGLAIGFAVHFALWGGGVVKGGDAKLMIGVGAVVGWQELIEATLWEFVLLIPVGVVVLAMAGRLSNFVDTLKYVAAKAQGGDAPKPEHETQMVFAPVIAAAVLMARVTDWFAVV